MRISSLKTPLANLTTDLLVLVTSAKELEKGAKPSQKSTAITFGVLNHGFNGQLSKTLERADFKATPGASFFFTLQDARIGSLLLVVAPENTSDTFEAHAAYRKFGATLFQHAKKVGAKKISVVTAALKLDKESHLTAFVEGMQLAGYTFTRYKSKPDTAYILGEVSLLDEKAPNQKVLDTALAMCSATMMARDLINMPPNDCTPPYLVKVAKEIAQKGKLKIHVYDKAELTKLGAHSLLSVSKGTAFPPFLIKMTYTPAKRTKKTKVISLVGKGITFDTGGYSLKPGDSMIGMGGDMAGAAAVLGAMQFVAAAKPNCEVRGYIPTTENMISGEATRVGDIVKAMNGKTIEILNTDAEGRLILADALVMACKDKSDIVIDLATLTGACMVALGTDYAGLFTDDDRLASDIVSTGAIEGERYWRLPLAPEYKESIKSKIADIKNISGNRWAGATIGGLFLQHFVSDCRWAHLDIAGPADASSSNAHITAGGVGFGVRTLGRLIMKQ